MHIKKFIFIIIKNEKINGVLLKVAKLLIRSKFRTITIYIKSLLTSGLKTI